MSTQPPAKLSTREVMTMAKANVIRPTIRFGPNQYALIQAELKARGVSFQAYVNELICRDLGVPLHEFELTADDGQMSVFDVTGNDGTDTPGS